MAKVQIYIEADSASEAMHEVFALAKIARAATPGPADAASVEETDVGEDPTPAPKARGGRKPKETPAEPAAAPAAQPSSAPEASSAAPAPASPPAADAGGITRQTLLDKVNDLGNNGIDVSVVQETILAKFGVGRISLLQPEQYPAALEALKALDI